MVPKTSIGDDTQTRVIRLKDNIEEHPNGNFYRAACNADAVL